MKNVINQMRSLYPISDDTICILKKHVELCRFPKRFQFIKVDSFCKFAYFIEEGATRSFWLVNGEEITTSFSCEGGIVFSMDELYYNRMSEEFVETLENVVTYKISLDDLLHLFRTNIELANWGRVIYIVRTKIVLHCLQKSGMKNSSVNFLIYTSGYNWGMSLLIWV